MSNFIKNFSELNKNDTHIAGGKGASLGEMTQAGIPVPPGFVVTAAAFDQFLAETDLTQEIEAQLDKVNYEDVNSVDKASNTIQDLIHDARFPKDLQEDILGHYKKQDLDLVAVRSSATAEDSSTASWAGELESYMNNDRDHLIGSIKKCWASLFTPRAIVYRNEKGLRKTKVSVAVVVQQMVQSDVSGITFTVHPVTQDYNQMIIEAGWGLGDAIVGGHVTPDSYVIHKDDLEIIDINLSEQEKKLVKGEQGGHTWVPVEADELEKQKLSGEQIVELAKICQDIEKHYGLPCDIEWAMTKKLNKWEFFITQSRPITTLAVDQKKKTYNIKDSSDFEKWLFSSNLSYLYTFNYDLLTLDIYHKTSLKNANYIGNKDSDYLFFSQKGEVAAYYPPPKNDDDSFENKDILQEVFKRSEKAKVLYKEFVEKYRNQSKYSLIEFFEDFLDIHMELVANFRTTRPAYVDPLVDKLKKLIENKGYEESVIDFLLISDSEEDEICSERLDWIKILKNKTNALDMLQIHAEKYPWLFPGSFDQTESVKILRRRKKEDQKNIEEKVKSCENDQKLKKEALAKKEELINTVDDQEFLSLIKTIVDLSDFRNYFKLTLSGLYYLHRENLVKIAQKTPYAPAIFFNSHTIEDIINVLSKGQVLDEKDVRSRNNYFLYYVIDNIPYIVSDSKYKKTLNKFLKTEKSDFIKAIGASHGIVEGEAVVCMNKDIPDLPAGYLDGKILVTSMTDPSIMPYIRKCLAFVTDEGGLTSHAAIVGRELQIPCVVGTETGSKIVQNGDVLKVDGGEGVVIILKRKS